MPTFKTESKSFLTQAPPPVPPAGPAEILAVQARLVQEGSDLAQVNAKSEEISGEIAKLKAGIPAPPVFDAPRESILADIALGKLKTDDLKRFDAESAAATKTHDAIVKSIREKTSPLESTSAGLRRKAAIHNRTLEALRTEHRRLCLEYLLEQAEIAGREYAESVTRAVKAMDLVVTFASLHVRAGGSNMIGKSGLDSIDFPPLGVESTRGTALPGLDPVSRAAAFDQAEEQILASLKAEGIAVPFPNVDVSAPAKPAKVRVPGIGEGTPIDIVRPAENRFPDGHVRPTQAVTE